MFAFSVDAARHRCNANAYYMYECLFVHVWFLTNGAKTTVCNVYVCVYELSVSKLKCKITWRSLNGAASMLCISDNWQNDFSFVAFMYVRALVCEEHRLKSRSFGRKSCSVAFGVEKRKQSKTRHPHPTQHPGFSTMYNSLNVYARKIELIWGVCFIQALLASICFPPLLNGFSKLKWSNDRFDCVGLRYRILILSCVCVWVCVWYGMGQSSTIDRVWSALTLPVWL